MLLWAKVTFTEHLLHARNGSKCLVSHQRGRLQRWNLVMNEVDLDNRIKQHWNSRWEKLSLFWFFIDFSQLCPGESFGVVLTHATHLEQLKISLLNKGQTYLAGVYETNTALLSLFSVFKLFFPVRLVLNWQWGYQVAFEHFFIHFLNYCFFKLYWFLIDTGDIKWLLNINVRHALYGGQEFCLTHSLLHPQTSMMPREVDGRQICG